MLSSKYVSINWVQDCQVDIVSLHVPVWKYLVSDITTSNNNSISYTHTVLEPPCESTQKQIIKCAESEK